MLVKTIVADLPEKAGDSWNERIEWREVPDELYNRATVVCRDCQLVDYPSCMKTCRYLPKDLLQEKMKELGVS